MNNCIAYFENELIIGIKDVQNDKKITQNCTSINWIEKIYIKLKKNQIIFHIQNSPFNIDVPLISRNTSLFNFRPTCFENGINQTSLI